MKLNNLKIKFKSFGRRKYVVWGAILIFLSLLISLKPHSKTWRRRDEYNEEEKPKFYTQRDYVIPLPPLEKEGRVFIERLNRTYLENCLQNNNRYPFRFEPVDSPLVTVHMSALMCDTLEEELYPPPLLDPIVIVTTMDQYYEKNAFWTLLNSLYHSHPDEDIMFIVFAVDIPATKLSNLCRTNALFFPRIRVQFYTLDQSTLWGLFNYKNEILVHVSISTMVRLLLPSLLPDLDVILYVDGDTIIMGSLRELQDGTVCYPPLIPSDNNLSFQSKVEVEPNGGKLCAKLSILDTANGWLDEKQKCVLSAEMRKGFPLFNAGVIRISLAKMREWGFVRFATNLSQLKLNDQTILNIYAGALQDVGQFSTLDSRYNIFNNQDTNLYPVDEFKIVHFASRMKPWVAFTEFRYKWIHYAFPAALYVWSSLVEELPVERVRETIRASAENVFVSVVCSTQHCMDTVGSLADEGVRVRAIPLRLDYLVRVNSPLTPWFEDHARYKIWAGALYPKYFHQAVQLAYLYEHGGILLDWNLVVAKDLRVNTGHITWCIQESSYSVLRFQAGSKAVHGVMEQFMQEFESHPMDRPLRINRQWDAVCSNFLPQFQRASHESLAAAAVVTTTSMTGMQKEKHFGVISMEGRAKFLYSIRKNSNLGDEVQGLASVQWLPMVDVHVDRDNYLAGGVGKYPAGSITLFVNAWYGVQDMIWPPPPSLNPIMLSIHVEPGARAKFTSTKSVAYMKALEPIGARSLDTQQLLSKAGVETFFSGCMTTTMQRFSLAGRSGNIDTNRIRQNRHHQGSSYLNLNADCEYLVIDVVDDPLLPGFLRKPGCEMSPHTRSKHSIGRFLEAFELVGLYSRAKLVITSRLHTALPSASMGIPVLLVLSDSMPGGGGKSDGYRRFTGLSELVHTVDLANPEGARHFLQNFNFDSPPPNPGYSSGRFAELRCNFFYHIQSHHPELVDSIRVFDIQRIFHSC